MTTIWNGNNNTHVLIVGEWPENEAEISQVQSSAREMLNYLFITYYKGGLDEHLNKISKLVEQAEKQVKSRLVLEAVVEAEKLEASIDEIEEKVKEMATNYGKEADELMKNEQLINYIKDSMKAEKAVKFVVDNAKIK